MASTSTPGTISIAAKMVTSILVKILRIPVFVPAKIAAGSLSLTWKGRATRVLWSKTVSGLMSTTWVRRMNSTSCLGA